MGTAAYAFARGIFLHSGESESLAVCVLGEPDVFRFAGDETDHVMFPVRLLGLGVRFFRELGCTSLQHDPLCMS
jgi:hypothetical protein